MDNPVDLLQIKIEKAKAELPEETLNAIATVDWRTVVLGMRQSKGYNFEQLGDLELETELLLCGLLSPEDYPKELEKRMRLSRLAVNELVNEMNTLVFKKIKEELIKNSERKRIFQKRNAERKILTPALTGVPVPSITPLGGIGINKTDTDILKSAGIEVMKPANVKPEEKPIEQREEILKKVENPEAVHPILAQKILGSVQIPTVKTEYSLENISKPSSPSAIKSGLPTNVTSKIKPAPLSENSAPKSYTKNADPYRLSPDD